MKKPYAIVRANRLEQLVEAVNAFCEEGYVCIGGVSQYEDGGYKPFMQAMVLKDNRPQVVEESFKGLEWMLTGESNRDLAIQYTDWKEKHPEKKEMTTEVVENENGTKSLIIRYTVLHIQQ